MLTLILLLAAAFLSFSLNDKLQAERRRRELVEQQLRMERQRYKDFLASYQTDAKPSQRKLLERMQEDYLAASSGAVPVPDAGHRSWTPRSVPVPPPAMASSGRAKPAQSYDLDSESILLYFGAFLFVASAGLFVWLGSAPGAVKAIMVAVVTAVLYSGGIWLYHNRPKLKLAGQAFSGIGIALAPLVGVAAYVYVFDHTWGYAVWMLTSAVCLGLYAHGFRTFRSSLMAYIIILTVLSLFESAVGIAGLPLYVYGWGLAVVAIGLQLAAYSGFLGGRPLAEDAGSRSADYFMPAALLVAVIAAPSLGASQLGVSLILASAYYSVSFLGAQGLQRRADALAAQASFIGGLPLFVLGATGGKVAYALLAAAVSLLVQTIVMLFMGRSSWLWNQYGYTLLVGAVLVGILAVGYPSVALVSCGAVIVIGSAVWHRLALPAAYGVAATALAALPFVYGQLFLDDISGMAQVILSFSALVVLAAASLVRPAWRQVRYWHTASSLAIGFSIVATMLASLYTGPYICLAVTLVVMSVMLMLAVTEKSDEWIEPVVLVAAIPLLRAIGDSQALLASTAVMLASLSLMTLRSRTPVLRWGSTVLWLLLPWALGLSGLLGNWNEVAYAWAYLAAGVVLLALRAVALGRIFASDKVRVISMLRSASLSYAVGYAAAAAIGLSSAVASQDVRVHVTLLGLMLMTLAVVAAVYVERRREILAVLPVLLQLVLLSGIAPKTGNGSMVLYLLVSSAAAAALFFAARSVSSGRTGGQSLVLTALFTGLCAPAAVLFTDAVWPMAFGLIVFGVMLFEYASDKHQGDREWSLAVITLGFGWMLYIAGIREFQVYSHIVAALFVGLAVWRHALGQQARCNEYIWLALASATIPLALQTLTETERASFYGWWMLLEQVAIMLIGIMTRRSLVVRWGLYVAVASVLYQLRGLGYAALAFLALFLIGLAVYRLQRNDKKPSE